VFNTQLGSKTEFTAGATYQMQHNNYFKRMDDLLGGEFYVNLNQFAERDFPTNALAAQNNADRPNQIVRVGDKYGYDYDINVQRAAAWAQAVVKLQKIDFFASAELSTTSFYREGNVRNGLFLNNSLGKSATLNFTNYAVKGGITYKINGRNFIYTPTVLC
ncbi:MAG: TonB-dependent receptor, partial [Bacteroidetes bacterium]